MGKPFAVAIALFALAAVPSLTNASADESATDHEANAAVCIAYADDALASERYDEAAHLYERALVLEPGSVAARIGAVRTALAMRRDPNWPRQ